MGCRVAAMCSVLRIPHDECHMHRQLHVQDLDFRCLHHDVRLCLHGSGSVLCRCDVLLGRKPIGMRR